MVDCVKSSMLYQEIPLLVCVPEILTSGHDKKKSILILGFLVTYIPQYFKVPEWEIKLGSYCFLPHHFQLIIHYHPFIWRYAVVVSSTTATITSKSFRYVGSNYNSHVFKFRFNNVTGTKVYTTNETLG